MIALAIAAALNTSTARGVNFTPNTPSLNRRSHQGPSPHRSPGSQESMGCCDGLRPPSHNRTIDSQQYYSPNDPRYDGPYPRSGGGTAAEANKTQ
jgi:hypothetical protein